MFFLKKTSDVLLLRKERRQNYRKYYNQKHFYILKIDGLWGSTTYQFQYFLIICLLIVKTWRYDREGDPVLFGKISMYCDYNSHFSHTIQ